VCKKLLKSETHLRVHLKIHMREAHQETKECAKCDAVFESTGEYFKHVKIHESEHLGPKYQQKKATKKACPHCGKVLACLTMYNHQRECKMKADRKLHQCELCPFATAYKESLNMHKSKKHNIGDKPFKCHATGCTWTFRRKCELDQHFRRRHELKPVVCETCGHAAKNPYELSNHTYRTHGDHDAYLAKRRQWKANGKLRRAALDGGE